MTTTIVARHVGLIALVVLGCRAPVAPPPTIVADVVTAPTPRLHVTLPKFSTALGAPIEPA
ncbi:MAG: hypothetical protein ACHREM_27345, partial [Polyangiales bacterium]